jgi:hypothetical protein
MITQDQKELIDSLNQRTARLAELPKVIDQTEKVVNVLYDFSVDAGATGTIDLGYTFEEDCFVTGVLADEITAFTSGGSATVTLQYDHSGSKSDITGDIAYDSGFSSVTSMALEGSAAGIRVAEGDTLYMKIGAAALTAGKCRFYVRMLPRRANHE